MPWTGVRYPDGRIMTHQQVLTVDNLEVPDHWPILSVREDLIKQRAPQPNTFHMTELGIQYVSKSELSSSSSRSTPGLFRSHKFLLERHFNPDMELGLYIFRRSLRDHVPHRRA